MLKGQCPPSPPGNLTDKIHSLDYILLGGGMVIMERRRSERQLDEVIMRLEGSQ